MSALNVGAGTGYSDVSPKQVVRTSNGRVYLIAPNCDSYPCTASSQTLRIYRSNTTEIPTAFVRQDSAHEPSDVGCVGMAIDGADLIHIAWQDRNGASNSRIRYNTFNTSTNLWGTAENCDGDLGTPIDGGQGDQFCAIALDSNGVPHVAFLYDDGTRRRLAYRNRSGGTWSARTTTIDDNTYTGNRKAWHPNIAFDTNGRRVFAWEVGAFNGDTDGQLCVRVMDTDDSLGTRVDLGAATAKVGIDQSTALLCNGQIHLAYILGGAVGNEFIRYYYATEAKSPSFTANHPTNIDTHNPSIAYGGPGKLRIYCHGSESPNDDSLYYLEGTGGAGGWSARTLVATGEFDASVSSRWSQYFWSRREMLDIVFWDQNYPNDLYYNVDQVGTPPRPLFCGMSA